MDKGRTRGTKRNKKPERWKGERGKKEKRAGRVGVKKMWTQARVLSTDIIIICIRK